MAGESVQRDILPPELPEPTHPRTPETESDDELEATELRDVSATRPGTGVRTSRILSPADHKRHWYDPIARFWRHHVRISVPHDDCRDHLGELLQALSMKIPKTDVSAANERTFLGYLRTSLALSMIGVLIAQLYRLQHSPTPSQIFGYFLLSKPLACIFQGAALYMACVGACRFFRQQSAMALGKVHAGGWELALSASFVLLVWPLNCFGSCFLTDFLDVASAGPIRLAHCCRCVQRALGSRWLLGRQQNTGPYCLPLARLWSMTVWRTLALSHGFSVSHPAM